MLAIGTSRNSGILSIYKIRHCHTREGHTQPSTPTLNWAQTLSECIAATLKISYSDTPLGLIRPQNGAKRVARISAPKPRVGQVELNRSGAELPTSKSSPGIQGSLAMVGFSSAPAKAVTYTIPFLVTWHELHDEIPGFEALILLKVSHLFPL